jgi:hypothetical protein
VWILCFGFVIALVVLMTTKSSEPPVYEWVFDFEFCEVNTKFSFGSFRLKVLVRKLKDDFVFLRFTLLLE